jgi:hypothetical protein
VATDYTDLNTVHNPSAGGIAPASWGDLVRDNFQWLAVDLPRVRVTNAGAFSHTSSGTAMVVPFGTEAYDVGAMHNLVSNTGRLTAPVDGTYTFCGGGTWASHATGVRTFQWRVDGTTTLPETWRNESATDTTPGGQVISYYSLTAGQYVELMAFQNSGGTLALNSTYAWMRWDST